ncbi:MAG: hypothetical protein M1836_006424 [Candelina mexicana]|nr:MAG: hypothetical protein M1836_006424 [Candelina mexicana]
MAEPNTSSPRSVTPRKHKKGVSGKRTVSLTMSDESPASSQQHVKRRKILARVDCELFENTEGDEAEDAALESCKVNLKSAADNCYFDDYDNGTKLAANDDAHSTFSANEQRISTLESRINASDSRHKTAMEEMNKKHESLTATVTRLVRKEKAADANRARFLATIRRKKGDNSPTNQANIYAGNQVAHGGDPIWDAELVRSEGKNGDVFREVYDITIRELDLYKDSKLAVDVFSFRGELYAEDVHQAPSRSFLTPAFDTHYRAVREIMNAVILHAGDLNEEFRQNASLQQSFAQLKVEFENERTRGRQEAMEKLSGRSPR